MCPSPSHCSFSSSLPFSSSLFISIYSPTLTVGTRLPSASYYLPWKIPPYIIILFPLHVSWLWVDLASRFGNMGFVSVNSFSVLLGNICFLFGFMGVSSGFIHITLFYLFLFEINAHHNIWIFVVFFTVSSSMAYMLRAASNDSHPKMAM